MKPNLESPPEMRHLITPTDLSASMIERVFAITEDLKTKYATGLREAILPGRVMALLFEKPSLRTRVSFESAITNLGGNSLFLGDDVGWGSRESVADFGRVLSEYVDVIVARTKSHQSVVDLASYCTCSVINGLTDYVHPCQALADLYTLRERFGDLKGRKLTFIGDGNNVSRSLAICCGRMGMRFSIATPPEYRFDDDFREILERQVPELDLEETDDPVVAVTDSSCVYTDVWVSMGQEVESQKRLRDFANFQVDRKLMSHAPDEAVFMHCLPARRGEEVTADVIDGPQSVVVQEAGNRMHVQKGILAWMLGPQA